MKVCKPCAKNKVQLNPFAQSYPSVCFFCGKKANCYHVSIEKILGPAPKPKCGQKVLVW